MPGIPKPPKLTKAEKDQMNLEVRARDLYCQKCGVWALSGDVHHKKTRGAHGDAAWTKENMELLCRKCYSTIDFKGAT